MGRLERHASSGVATGAWHRINWATCHRRVRSLRRRIVQAVRTGAWRQVKRLCYLVGHSVAARAFAGKGVPENAGQTTPGVAGERWKPPALKACAVETMGRWRGYQAAPLKRVYIPKKNGTRRPLRIPAWADRARQAVYLQALPPLAETTGEPNAAGFRPKRQGADAIDQCFKILPQQTSASWILDGDMQGFFENMAVSGLDQHLPMNKRVLAKWLHSGCRDRGALLPPTSGVPQGGSVSPVIATMVVDGLETVVKGHERFRRASNSN